MNEFFLIAEVKAVYNSRGYLSLISFTDFPDRFYKLKEIFIDVFGGRKQLEVEAVENVKGNFVLKIKNFDSADEAEIFVGKRIYIKPEDSVKLPADIFFVHDLIGSDVFINSKFFGSLVDVLNLPANDVYVIKNSEGKEVMFPALKKFIKSFDTENKKLVLDIDEDFFDEDED
ncbi:MAG: 16S rRNA processing protein RimM [Melioribacteraceae bacterium]|nr:MAG: 16S rRNA processing protein RimM [Melioribacteraceae bacterium]